MDQPMAVANALTWNKGDTIMKVDAFSSPGGTVVLKDFAGYGAGKAENARAAQSDL